MKFRIRADPAGPLRILDQLPASSLAVLEGLNGIGKTLAIRLLQLCSGVMPYRADSAAWASLCEGLGEFVVEATNLRGGETIRWQGDSRTWPREFADTPRTEWFAGITIDDRPARLEEVRRLLRVYRVAGDEGLVETLAEEVETYSEVIRGWSRRTVGDESPTQQLQDVIGRDVDRLANWTTKNYGDVQEASKEAGRELVLAREELANLLEQQSNLRVGARLAEKVASLTERFPEIQLRASQLDQQIVDLQSEKKRLDTELTGLVAREAVDQPRRRELNNARRTLERNEYRVSESSKRAASLARRLGVVTTVQDVRAALNQTETDLEELRAAQTEMDAAPVMRTLLDDVSNRLGEAVAQGLPDQVAFDDPASDIELTVDQLRAGVTNRRVQLEGQPPPPEIKDLATRIVEVTQRRQHLRELSGQLDELTRRRRLVEQNEARVESALASISNVTTGDLRALEGRRREVEQSLIELATERAALRDELGGDDISSLETLESQLRAVLEEIGLPSGQVGQALEECDRQVDQARERVEGARATSSVADRDLSRAEAEITRAWDSFSRGVELEWLRDALRVESAASPPVAVRLEILTQAKTVLDRVLERLGSHRDHLAAVEQALNMIARHLRGRDVLDVEYVPELQRWLAEDFGAWFNTPVLRSELFPQASAEIEVDVQTKEVSWREDGSARSRPLEAFSSGEQAFAYTRARLAMLDEEEPVQNRLITLDEFGAFIALDRLTQLLRYLKDRAEQYPFDQVLVILPLSHDYEQQSESVFGGQQEELEDLAAQVKERSYAVRELV